MEVTTQPLKKDEFIKDGLIHCEKCLQPRQVIIDMLGKEKKVRCICKCEKAKLDAEEEERKQKEKLRQINEMKVKSLLGDRYKNVCFENTELVNPTFNKAIERCKNYCSISNKVLEEGWGIYIYGIHR